MKEIRNAETSAERRQMLQDCQTGVLRYCSIHVTGGTWSFHEVETPDGRRVAYHSRRSGSWGVWVMAAR